jgi:phosphatidylglycerophosphatase A
LSNSPQPRTGWVWAVATFLGIGFLKPGPGTIASAPVALIWLFLGTHHGGPAFNAYWTIVAIVITLLGVAASNIVARQSGIEDPSHVVIDEVAGQAIALIGAPGFGWKYSFAAFILFRVFDIVKPPPVRQLERLPGGWGIMMDDVAAGVFALVLLHIAARFHLFL